MIDFHTHILPGIDDGSADIEMTEKMLEMGAVEAINLDGGATATMIFMGDVINHPAGTNTRKLRSMSSMIGVREPPAETGETE